jgi:aminoglycoside phosphotransferase family enzyme
MVHAQNTLVENLRRPDAYPHAVKRVESIETHISWVFLTGSFVYKIKKAIELPFVDFSTLERRERFCREELRLNRRLAPDYYLDVVPIGGTPERPVIGREPAIEFAVKMRQFSAHRTADRLIGRGGIDADAIRALADTIAEFHGGLEAQDVSRGTATSIENLDELEQLLDAPRRDRLRPVGDWTRETREALADKLEHRRGTGRVKECHGDLHLGNLACTDDTIVPFDALEFDAALRTIDVADEAAFTAMDLMAHDRRDLAYEFLNRYLERSGDYDALSVLRHCLVKRALVRAKVHAIASQQHDEDATAKRACDRYLDVAEDLVTSRRPLLAITRGLSGSGKTTVGDALIARVPALRARSDIERKRLHGLSADDRSGSGIGAHMYSKSADNATYGALADAAEQALAGGFDFIVDASV